MPDPTQELFQQLGISFLLGVLVGLQRQRSDSGIAGLRTFPLFTVLGTMAAALDQQNTAGGWIIGAAFIGVLSIILVRNIYQLGKEEADFGTTTEAAILLMFAVGAYLVGGDRVVAVVVGAAVAVLLQFKPELHGLAAKLGDVDVRAIMQFVLITCVILPVLPNQTYGPFAVLNPHETWLMVVLMVGISLGGYLTYKFFGRSAGLLLGGILGGAISSTATTMSYSKRSSANPSSVKLSALVIMIASSMVYLRVLLEILIKAPEHFNQLSPPIVIMMVASIVAAGIVWSRSWREKEEMPEQANPTELKSAVTFGLLYAGVLFALAAAKEYLNQSGLFLIATLSGLTDMDAITLVTAGMVQTGEAAGGISADIGWRLIVVAAMSNLFFKACIAGMIGHRRLLWLIIMLFSVPMATGGFLLWLWPLGI